MAYSEELEFGCASRRLIREPFFNLALKTIRSWDEEGKARDHGARSDGGKIKTKLPFLAVRLDFERKSHQYFIVRVLYHSCVLLSTQFKSIILAV